MRREARRENLGPSRSRFVSFRRPPTGFWRIMRMRTREGSPCCAVGMLCLSIRGRLLCYRRVAGSGPALVGPRSAFLIGFAG